MRHLVATAVFLSTSLLTGCGGDASGHVVRVEVVTKLVPAEDFDTVSTTLESEGPLERKSFPAQPGDDFAGGLQTAEFTGVSAGRVRVRVALLRDDSVVAERAVRAVVDHDRVVPVAIIASELPGDCSPDCYCAELAKLSCESEQNCCRSEPSATLNECLDEVASICETQLLPLLEDERTGYDPALAADLVGEARELVATCDPRGILMWASNDLFDVMRGTESRGTRCDPIPSVEEDPAALFSCDADMDLTCRPTESSGWACQGLSSEGGPCATHYNCRAGMYCQEGTCRPRLSIGGSCTAHEQCASLLCADGACVEAKASLFCDHWFVD